MDVVRREEMATSSSFRVDVMQKAPGQCMRVFFSYSSSTTNWTEKKKEIIFFYPKINLRNELQKSHTGKAWGQNEILAKFYTFIEKNESLVP